jgi:predicted secreted hydrolase
MHRHIHRRALLKVPVLLSAAGLAWHGLGMSAVRASSFYPSVVPRPLVFPRDFGAHPDHRTEWWYLTGWLGEGAGAMGFQLTFFRSRTKHAPENPSRFAPRQLLFAHAALAMPHLPSLRHAERAGRLGRASLRASEQDTDLQFEDWYLRRVGASGSERYLGYFAGDGFSLELEAQALQPPVLRGEQGYSRKGPRPEQASHYYSRAPLSVKARVRDGQALQLREGQAWLDHEWSSQLLMPGAVGWDWIGINLLDGGTLMAFRIRDDKGQTLYDHVDVRGPGGAPEPGWKGLRWEPVGRWRSSRSLIEYPVPMALKVGSRRLELAPLMLAQEVDARASTGGFYWEGAVELRERGQLLGRGYLELTGYGGALRL